jgi:hypothetical protein
MRSLASMANTENKTVKKRKNAERNKQYRLKRKLLMKRQASTSTRIVVMRIGYIF